MHKEVIIPADRLQGVDLPPEELMLELAIALYSSQKMSIGQACKLSGRDLISFQKELATHGVYLHISLDEVKSDLRNLQELL